MSGRVVFWSWRWWTPLLLIGACCGVANELLGGTHAIGFAWVVSLGTVYAVLR